MSNSHYDRVQSELSKAGVSRYGLLRAEGRNLPNIIHPEEHIKAAVYGRTTDGSAMLVATDRRIIFYDKKPLITISDEISYEVVSGIGVNRENGVRASLTLFTRMGEYTIRYASPRAVDTFKSYIETNRLEGTPQPDTRRTKPVTDSAKQTLQSSIPKTTISPEAAQFLASHELAVLSTIDRTNQLHGAAVYYLFNAKAQTIHILTKSQTQKSHNILATHQVAVTVYDEAALQTAQLQGLADIETDEETKQHVYMNINRIRDYNGERHHPPVTKLLEGHFMVYRISITSARFHDFKYHR